MDDGDESLSDYVGRCNLEAEAAGGDLRLHEVSVDADAHVFVAMTNAAFAALVENGYPS